jgi:hypothetical protein
MPRCSVCRKLVCKCDILHYMEFDGNEAYLKKICKDCYGKLLIEKKLANPPRKSIFDRLRRLFNKDLEVL